MPETVIELASYDRCLFVGKTGSGKTFAARHILAPFPRLIVIDPKGTLGGKEWKLEPWGRSAKNKLRRGKPVRTRVTVEFGVDMEELWDEVYFQVYASGNCTLYIDEMYGVVDPGSKPSRGMTAIWTRGRELQIGAYAATQRPVWIPLFALSEAEHFFSFRLSLNDDRKRMSEFMGPQVLRPVGDRHGVYYSQAEWDEPIYIKRLPIGGSKASEQETGPRKAEPQKA